MRRGLWVLWVLSIVGCGGDPSGMDGGGRDAAAAPDAGRDAGRVGDAGAGDAGAGDAGAGDAGAGDAGVARDAGAGDAGAGDAGAGDAGAGDAGAGDAEITTGCGPTFEVFPAPVADGTALTSEVDDGFLRVAFSRGFSFRFYGTTYDEIVLGTNGSMTFGGASAEADAASAGVASADVASPSIAPLWGDMDAAAFPSSVSRDMQMSYQQCADSFLVGIFDLQAAAAEGEQNSVIVTLYPDGTIDFDYGGVASSDVMVGVFDGTHGADATEAPPFASMYAYGGAGRTGLILYDRPTPAHSGELIGLSLRLTPR